MTETSTSVAIAALAATPSGNQVCQADLAIGATTVTLSAPLGSRTLLHAEVTTDWRSYDQNLG